MNFVRNFARYAGYGDDLVTLFPSLAEFLASPPQKNISSILYGETTLDLRILDHGASTLIVAFHAAVDPTQTSLPVFVGKQVTDNVDANVLFISEPALNKGVSIGWYAGFTGMDLQRDLVAVIQHIATELSCDNVVFWGASAGGFAALYYSHEFPHSLAIAVNPQTSIGRYHPDKVEDYAGKCWDKAAIDKVPATTNVIDLYRTSFPNYVLYLQNSQDDFHIENHFHPWSEVLGARRRTRWSSYIGDWGQGHNPPPPFFVEAALQLAAQAQGDWTELLNDPDFNID